MFFGLFLNKYPISAIEGHYKKNVIQSFYISLIPERIDATSSQINSNKIEHL